MEPNYGGEMNKLIVSDVQPDVRNLEPYNRRVMYICNQLKKKHPDWIYLDEFILPGIATNSTKYIGKTFITPGSLAGSRFPTKKVTILFAHLVSMSRKLDFSFVVVGPVATKLDLRVRGYIDSVEIYENDGT